MKKVFVYTLSIGVAVFLLGGLTGCPADTKTKVTTDKKVEDKKAEDKKTEDKKTDK